MKLKDNEKNLHQLIYIVCHLSCFVSDIHMKLPRKYYWTRFILKCINPNLTFSLLNDLRRKLDRYFITLTVKDTEGK